MGRDSSPISLFPFVARRALGQGAFGRVLALLTLSVVALSSFAVPAPADALELRMLADPGSVRHAPDPNSAVVATVPAGTPLQLSRETRAWYLVDLPREKNQPALRGYVALSDAEWIAECDPNASEGLEPGDVFRDCDTTPRMVVIPAGSFIMGSPESEAHRDQNESPRTEVTIPAPFAVGVFEVTFEDWEHCVRMGGCGGWTPDDEGYGQGRRPTPNVNWHYAQLYVQWASGLTGKRYRLLTEAEWEYATRAGSTTPNYWAPEDDPCAFANGYDQTGASFHGFIFQYDRIIPCEDGFTGTAPVGSYPPNAFGLYDMIGNVAEWTQDCYHADYSGRPKDGSAWEFGLCFIRVMRGGSWFNGERWLRAAARVPRLPQGATSTSGFRVARDLD